MKLSIKDRITIFFGLLPLQGNIQTIKKVKDIKKKIELSKEEEFGVVALSKTQDGNIVANYIDENKANEEKEIIFTKEELSVLINHINMLDSNNNIIESQLDIIEKLLSFSEKN